MTTGIPSTATTTTTVTARAQSNYNGGGGTSKQIGTSVLHSLQRRFIQQQTLETPTLLRRPSDETVTSNTQHIATTTTTNAAAPPPPPQPPITCCKSIEDDEDLDGFVLFSQPAYERVLSQRAPSDATPLSQIAVNDDDEEHGATIEPTMLCVCPSNDGSLDALPDEQQHPVIVGVGEEGQHRPGSNPHAVDDDEDVLCLSQPPVTAGEATTAPFDTVGIINTTGMAAHAGHTPAVHSVDRVQLSNAQAVFPIFRSKKDCKTVYIIRHGESEYNRAISNPGSGWSDPLIFDAMLTATGRRQATALRDQVARWNLPEDAVWVTSPLSRAIETMLLAFPGSHACGSGSGNGQASGVVVGDKPNYRHAHHRHPSTPPSTGCPCHCEALLESKVHILPSISEFLKTSGDVGRPPALLADRFPQLRRQLMDLSPCWWYSEDEDPNCFERKLFGKNETKALMQRRVKEFRKWILDRPEKVFVAVGHSMFWKEFATACKNGVKQEHLRNCSWMQLHV